MILPARLRLEVRSVKRFDANGKPVTLKFAVPVLDIDVALVGLSASGVPVAELSEPEPRPEPSGWSPVPQLPEGPIVSVRDQLDEVERDVEPRRNGRTGAEPIRPTGVTPRQVDEGARLCSVCERPLEGVVIKVAGTYVHEACARAMEEPEDEFLAEKLEDQINEVARPAKNEGEADTGKDTRMRSGEPDGGLPLTGRKPSAKQRSMMQALAAKVYVVSDDLPPETVAELRHEWRVNLARALGYEVESTRDLNAAGMSKMIDTLNDIEAGLLDFDGEHLHPLVKGQRVLDIETGEVL